VKRKKKQLQARDINWAVIRLTTSQSPCVLCRTTPTSWTAQTTKGEEVLLCFECGDSQGKG
jgi:hypothetical protein